MAMTGEKFVGAHSNNLVDEGQRGSMVGKSKLARRDKTVLVNSILLYPKVTLSNFHDRA